MATLMADTIPLLEVPNSSLCPPSLTSPLTNICHGKSPLQKRYAKIKKKKHSCKHPHSKIHFKIRMNTGEATFRCLDETMAVRQAMWPISTSEQRPIVRIHMFIKT